MSFSPINFFDPNPNNTAEEALAKINQITNTSYGPTILSGVVPLARFSPVDDGSADAKEAIRSAIAMASGNRLRRVKIRSGTYLLNNSGDADTIQIPANVVLECDDGTVFKHGRWGNPAFAMTKVDNVGITGASFVFTGTWMTPPTSGTVNKFGYGIFTSAYEWCCHIAVTACNNYILQNLKCSGETTDNILNSLISVRGNPDFTSNTGGRILDIYPDDVCQGILGWGFNKAEIARVYVDRWSSKSNDLYGPAHALYVTRHTPTVRNQRMSIHDIDDVGAVRLGPKYVGDHLISLKALYDSDIYNIRSTREEGVINMSYVQRLRISNVEWEVSGPMTGNQNTGIYLSVSTGNTDISFNDISLRTLSPGSNCSLFAVHSTASGADNVRMNGSNIRIVRNASGTEVQPPVIIRANDSFFDFNITELGVSTTTAVSVTSPSERNKIKVSHNSGDGNLVLSILGNNNKVIVDPGVTFNLNESNDSTDSNGNIVGVEATPKAMFGKSLPTAQNPGTTIQLPINSPGTYSVIVSLVEESLNSDHGMSAAFKVTYRNNATTDITSVQPDGAPVPWGTKITALSIASVTSTGLCTITSTTTTAEAFKFRYGYTKLSGL